MHLLERKRGINNMSCEEELEERFTNMDILELEDIVRNKKNEI